MLRFLSLAAMLAVLAAGAVRAQDVVQEFSGTGETTTAMFTVGDRWEVRWNARQAISVAALSSNGTLVAGASGVLRGSLFVPAGGQYYLKVTDGTMAPSTPASTNTPSATTNTAPSASTTNAPPAAITNAPKEVIPEPAPIIPEVDTPTTPAVSWHLQVIQVPAEVASTNALTVYNPYFTVPDSAITAVTPPPPPPPPTLTQDQINSLVTIKGDNAQGNGFLVRDASGVYVVAHLRLLAANPNLLFSNSSGVILKVLSIKAATDRNLALVAVQDDNLKALPMPDKNTPAPLVGDRIIIPVIGQADPTAGSVGKIVAVNPGRIDFDASVTITSNSAPLIDVESGAVLGIVTAEKRVNLTEATAKAWPGNPAPGTERITPYFGLALGQVAGWETLDLPTFDRETNFLQAFHDTTRGLDSFLNGTHRDPEEPAAAPTAPPDSRTFRNNSKILDAANSYQKFEGLDAARELLFDLQGIADTDVNRLQSFTPGCAFSRRSAQEELAYRKAIRAELDSLSDSDHIKRLVQIAGSR